MMSKRAERDLLYAVSVYFHNTTLPLVPNGKIYQDTSWVLYPKENCAGNALFHSVLRTPLSVAGEASSVAEITLIGHCSAWAAFRSPAWQC